jgi:mono/diheme cytochrome c family protein
MKRLLLVVAVLTLTAIDVAAEKPATEASASMVSRGKYIVMTSACDDCHTPKKMGPNGPVLDMSRLLSGHPESEKLPPPPVLPAGPWMAVASWDLAAWSGPWGVSFPMNLTPDENTGIGSWSEETFVKAIRTGKHMGVSRPILPPMPWEIYKNWTDEDLKAVYAYLRTIPPIKNHIPDPVLPPNSPAAPKK